MLALANMAGGFFNPITRFYIGYQNVPDWGATSLNEHLRSILYRLLGVCLYVVFLTIGVLVHAEPKNPYPP